MTGRDILSGTWVSRAVGDDAPRMAGHVDRRRFVLGAAAGLMVPVLSRGADAAPGAGHVAEMRGEASAELEGARRPLAPAANVFVGDMLATGRDSRLAVDLGSGAHLRLGADTRFKIDRYVAATAGDFTLDTGAFKFEHEGRREGDLQFRSAYGLIAVRGTRFYAGPSKGAFGILVGAGRVEVSAAGRSVLLRAGEGTDFATPGAPPSPAKQWAWPRVEAMLKQFT